MTFSETTRTLRYELRSREIYIEKPINSPEILPSLTFVSTPPPSTIPTRHKLHNYPSLVSTNRSFEEHSSVGAPPLNSSMAPRASKQIVPTDNMWPKSDDAIWHLAYQRVNKTQILIEAYYAFIIYDKAR